MMHRIIRVDQKHDAGLGVGLDGKVAAIPGGLGVVQAAALEGRKHTGRTRLIGTVVIYIRDGRGMRQAVA